MNVMVVVCDALHPGFIGCYGSEWVQTPNLDRLANNGFVFDRCYPNDPSPGGWCRTGLTGIWQPRPMDVAVTKLTEMLAGSSVATHVESYETVQPATASLFQRLLGKGSGQSAVLETLQNHPRYRMPDADIPGRTEWIGRWQRQLAAHQRDPAAASSIEMRFDRLSETISERKREKQFVWFEVDLVCLNRDTTPWLAPESFEEMYVDEEVPHPIRDPMPGELGVTVADEDLLAVQAGYAARVSFFDELLGALLSQLPGGLGEWFVVVTADQGYPLGEHGVIGNYRSWLYEELAHVPLIVSDPLGRKASRSPSLVQSVDLYATLAEILELDVPEQQGRSWIPLVRGQPEFRRDYVCAGLKDEEYCIRTNHWSLLLPVRWDHDVQRQRELYSKPEDRWDTNNVEELHRDVANLLELQLRRYLDAVERDTFDFLAPLEEALLISQSE